MIKGKIYPTNPKIKNIISFSHIGIGKKTIKENSIISSKISPKLNDFCINISPFKLKFCPQLYNLSQTHDRQADDLFFCERHNIIGGI